MIEMSARGDEGKGEVMLYSSTSVLLLFSRSSLKHMQVQISWMQVWMICMAVAVFG